MTYTGIIVCIKIINYNAVALFEEMSRKLTPWNYKQGPIENFPLVGGGGRQPPTWALLGKNMCQNERIGSCWGDWKLLCGFVIEKNLYNFLQKIYLFGLHTSRLYLRHPDTKGNSCNHGAVARSYTIN